MEPLPEPEDVFNRREMWRLKRGIAWYENPLIPFAWGAGITLLGYLALAIISAQMTGPPPIADSGTPLWHLLGSAVFVGLGAAALCQMLAPIQFARFDKQYFERTGLTEQQYVEGLKHEVEHEASLRFTGMPDGNNVTAWHFSEDERTQAFQKYKDELLQQCAEDERKLAFRGYMARRMGMSVPYRGETFWDRFVAPRGSDDS